MEWSSGRDPVGDRGPWADRNSLKPDDRPGALQSFVGKGCGMERCLGSGDWSLIAVIHVAELSLACRLDGTVETGRFGILWQELRRALRR